VKKCLKPLGGKRIELLYEQGVSN